MLVKGLIRLQTGPEKLLDNTKGAVFFSHIKHSGCSQNGCQLETTHLFRISKDIVTGIIQIRKQNCRRSYLDERLIRVECHRPKNLGKKIKLNWVEMRPPMPVNWIHNVSTPWFSF